MHEFLRSLRLDSLLQQLGHYSVQLASAILILLIGWWLAARLANAFQRALGRAKIDATLGSFLRNVVYGVLLVVVLSAALDRAGVPSASVLTVLGAAGLAVGLALKDSLSNLAWGVLLVALRPYRAGDYVEAGGAAGTVERIGLMQTWLVTVDNRQAIVPNAVAGGAVIYNFNHRGTRRFDVKVGIGYDADIGRAMAVVRELFAADSRILAEPKPSVLLNGLGDSSVDLVVYAWTRSGDLFDAKSDFTRALKERFDAERINIPFPQREIRIVGDKAV